MNTREQMIKAATAVKTVEKNSPFYINPEKVDVRWCCHSNGVIFCFYKSDKPASYTPTNPVKEFNAYIVSYQCFSGFKGYMERVGYGKDANRLWYKMEQKEETPKLTTKEKNTYIRISKEAGTLPSYTLNDDKPMTGRKYAIMVVDLEEVDLTPSKLYLYLSTLRNIREKPGLVRAVVYLVEEKGMDYFAALVLASRVTIATTGHHIMNICRPYGIKNYNVNKATVPASAIKGVFGVVAEPRKHDHREVRQMNNGWACSATTAKAGQGIKATLTTEQLFNPEIIALLKTPHSTGKELAKLNEKLEELQKE